MFKLINCFLLICIIGLGNTLERELTIHVNPRKEDCFFQDVKSGQVIDFEYQVIDGSHGELDITFHIADPSGRILVADYKKSENSHRVEANTNGVYKFCFDNTFSAFNSKVIFFEFVIDGEDDDDDDLELQDTADAREIPGEVGVEELLTVINNMKNHIGKARLMQDLIKSTEARDRNLAEENFFIVNTFSAFQIVIMIVVGLIQVVMVKSLFDDSSRVKSLWKKLGT